MPIYVVDAFTGEAFSGNPAAVVLLEEPREEWWMQKIAAEMKHAETAFVTPAVEAPNSFALRWFTPSVEVDLCGHATLTTAHVLYEVGRVPSGVAVAFETLSGVLSCRGCPGEIEMDFPAEPAVEEEIPGLEEALGVEPCWTGRNRMDILAQLQSEESVRRVEPDFAQIEALGGRGVILSAEAAPGMPYDFVSRFFAPAAGVPEDDVTGSAHCCLGPFWASKLGRVELVGYQASRRGGIVKVQLRDDRVELGGRAVTVLEGVLRC